MIRQVKTLDELRACVPVISEAFLSVIPELGITRENCPSNSAFITLADLERMSQQGAAMFGLFDEQALQGFVALTQAKGSLYYLDKLAVVSAARHRGYGRELLDFSAHYVKNKGGDRISIGIVEENAVLKKWYMEYGFRPVRIQRFPHLPFTVCFLELGL